MFSPELTQQEINWTKLLSSGALEHLFRKNTAYKITISLTGK